ncbi:phosphomannomutase CpsG [Photobacterium atrarenae]|uniref:phosphomannomutase n=1 Tax=Photobacterium atrarenae TaxID=865757 RepID=A0ABY5GNG3_9GAMM|nr:phosphomannomutase CpsG [Photobacterium atrarenae]UTV30468.1 phosphomannomutase CpsG [Photobacterium atrarenae]
MPETLSCFKTYDIRGKLGEELNPDIAYRIGRAYGEYLQPKTVVLGADIRLSSEALKQALANGLMDAGANVLDLGLTGTEEVYFATFFLNVDGGIEITASHNPKNYNGMKLVRAGSQPISGDTGLHDIQRLAEANCFSPVRRRGTYQRHHLLPAYITHILSYIDTQQLTPLKLVVNAGNGAAGHVIDAIETQFKAEQIPVDFIKIHHEADGNFPNGVPNPLLPECRACTADAVKAHGADMGIAWDGDFDRCFLFDENGRFIEGYYIVGLLSEAFLKKQPGAKIIHDPRLTWNTIDIVTTHGGQSVQSKTGHAFMKERMRHEDAIYGGEMSAHHYFRHFAYCDSGMIPWLLVAELLCTTGKTLSALVDARIAAYPASGEINCQLTQPEATLRHVLDTYQSEAIETDFTDGISLSFSNWRFNLRLSNTEPVIRLNVESKADINLMQQKTAELLALLRSI